MSPYQCEMNNCYALAVKKITLDLQDYQIELYLCSNCLKEFEVNVE